MVRYENLPYLPESGGAGVLFENAVRDFPWDRMKSKPAKFGGMADRRLSLQPFAFTFLRGRQ